MDESQLNGDNPWGLLDEVAGVLRDRQTTTGHVQDVYASVAVLWTEKLRQTGLLKEDCALGAPTVVELLLLMKLGRLMHKPMNHDTYVDIVGYTTLLNDLRFGV